MTKENQSAGREANAAQPLGGRKGLVSNAGAKRTADKEQDVASADNISAGKLGDTFKKGG